LALSMARLNPQEAAEKWARNTTAAVEDYRRGVARVQVAPGAKAAQNEAGYVAGVQRSSRKWAQRVGGVSLGEWQEAASNKGAQRLGSGVAAAQDKMAGFMSEVLPHIEAGQRAIAGMPKGDVEQGIARAAAFMRHMSNFRRGGGRR